LKAQAITSRSWLAAMLERAAKKEGCRRRKKSTEKARPFAGMTGRLMIFLTSVPTTTASVTGGSQRPSRSGRRGVEETRGLFLVHEGKVCDARFHKACGGVTEGYENVWEGRAVPYLSSVSDARHPFRPVAPRTMPSVGPFQPRRLL